MTTPVLEIAFAPVPGRSIDDESTADGELWREIFSHVTNIKGLIRASWSLNHNNRDMNLFLVDWESYAHHERLMDEQGTLSKPIMDLMTGDFNMYHVQTSSQSRAWMYAPITYLQFYVNPEDVNHFATPLKTLTSLYAQAPGFKEVVSGDARNPPHHDPQGWMAGGKAVVVVLSGWESEEALAAALQSDGIAAAGKELARQCRLVEAFPCTFSITEKSRYEHKWRRLPAPYLKDIPLDAK